MVVLLATLDGRGLLPGFFPLYFDTAGRESLTRLTRVFLNQIRCPGYCPKQAIVDVIAYRVGLTLASSQCSMVMAVCDQSGIAISAIPLIGLFWLEDASPRSTWNDAPCSAFPQLSEEIVYKSPTVWGQGSGICQLGGSPEDVS